MGEQQEQCHLGQQGRDCASSKALCDFYVNRHRYLVICPGSHCETFSDKDLSDFPKNLKDSIVGQLRSNNQYCIIVEVESDSSEDSKPNIATVLTDRELQIVQLIAQGYSNKQVAHRLHISEWTVSTHLRRIFAKLDVDSRAAMVHQCSSLLNNLNASSNKFSLL
jgi:DNA-binding CsgD family transcriptional regulator